MASPTAVSGVLTFLGLSRRSDSDSGRRGQRRRWEEKGAVRIKAPKPFFRWKFECTSTQQNKKKRQGLTSKQASSSCAVFPDHFLAPSRGKLTRETRAGNTCCAWCTALPHRRRGRAAREGCVSLLQFPVIFISFFDESLGETTNVLSVAPKFQSECSEATATPEKLDT